MDRIQNMLWWSTAARRCGGDFVIVSEDLCDEFEEFKKKVYSIVKAVELIDVWCTAGGGGNSA